MAKRSATSPLESKGAIKKRNMAGEPDFSSVAQRRQIVEAVAAAVNLGTAQPVILDLVDENTGEQSSYVYYPAGREIGEWFLQYLELSAQTQSKTHYAITALIENEILRPDVEPLDVAAIFHGLYGDRIKSATDLGQFLVLLTPGEDPLDNPKQVAITSLNTFLYHQTCYTATGDLSSHSSSCSSSDGSVDGESSDSDI